MASLSTEQMRRAFRNPKSAITYGTKLSSQALRQLLLSRVGIGRHIYDYDWELLIILDTCRLDALQSVASEYEYLPTTVTTCISRGSETPEWLAATFTQDWKDEINKTVYISGNAWTSAVFNKGRTPAERWGIKWLPTAWDPVEAAEFERLIPAWRARDPKPYEYNGQAAPHPTPRIITDYTISMGREKQSNRVIAHYKQPHPPYDAEATLAERELKVFERHPFEYLHDGGARSKVWNAYINDLRAALDDIGVLLRNFSADRVIITADHGEAFGEFGVYSHRTGSFHPYVRQVPWISVSANDTETRNADIKQFDRNDPDVKQQLKSLGYYS